MNNGLHADTDMMNQTGKNTTSSGQNILENVTELDTVINSVRSDWSSQAGTEFVTLYDDIKSYLNRIAENISTYGENVVKSSNIYANAEQENVDNISSLLS